MPSTAFVVDAYIMAMRWATALLTPSLRMYLYVVVYLLIVASTSPFWSVLPYVFRRSRPARSTTFSDRLARRLRAAL